MSIETTKPPVICVLAMHRSGSSLMTQLLHTAGLYIGESDDLLEANAANEKGYWESKTVVEINDELLRLFNGSWDNPPAFPSDWLEHSEVIKLKERAKQWIEDMQKAVDESPSYSQWVLKDPRMCVTLPFWKELIPSMEFVIMYRDPYSVAQSLLRRDGKQTFEGLRLWFLYWRKIIAYTNNTKRVFILHHQLIEDWRSELNRVGSTIDVSGMNIQQHESELKDIISPSLTHFSPERHIAHIELLSSKEVSNSDIEQFILEEAEYCFKKIFDDATVALQELNVRIEDRQRDIHILHETIADRDAVIQKEVSKNTELLESHSNLSSKIEDYRQTIEDRQRDIHILHETIADRDAVIQKEVSKNTELLEEIQKLENTIQNMENTIFWKFRTVLYKLIKPFRQ